MSLEETKEINLQVNDFVSIRTDTFNFFNCEEQLKSNKEFYDLNGNLWKIIRQSSGWWSDIQPWIIKSVSSGLEVERFSNDLIKVIK